MILPDGPPKDRTTDVPFARRRTGLFRDHKISAVALCYGSSPPLPQQKSRSNRLLQDTTNNPASPAGTKTATNPHRCRVRRKRQRLPSCLLIENVSAACIPASPQRLRADTFPIKASDYTAMWLLRMDVLFPARRS